MSERAYRQRLEADIARWQADGVIPATAADAIRGTLKPVPDGVTIATVVAIVGGLLIAAAFLAFIAANWTAIARPARFAILLAGIAGAYGIGAWFDRSKRTVPGRSRGRRRLDRLRRGNRAHRPDVPSRRGLRRRHVAVRGRRACCGGADEFARGALAVALVAACIWSWMRVFELTDVHLPFVGFWFIAALLAVAWNAPVARHLVALAAIVWLINLDSVSTDRTMPSRSSRSRPVSRCCLGRASRLRAADRNRCAPSACVLSHYGAIALALTLATLIAVATGSPRFNLPASVLAIGVAAVVLPFIAALLGRRAGPALAGLSIGFARCSWRPAGCERPASTSPGSSMRWRSRRCCAS